ncbi:hypothetical protein ACRAWD_28900 [Caulobacter segnis]
MVRHGRTVRALVRDPGKGRLADVDYRRGDASDREAVVAAAQGASVIRATPSTRRAIAAGSGWSCRCWTTRLAAARANEGADPACRARSTITTPPPRPQIDEAMPPQLAGLTRGGSASRWRPGSRRRRGRASAR